MSSFSLSGADFPRLYKKPDPYARAIEVSIQAKKNLRAALKGNSAIDVAGRTVAEYLNLSPDRKEQIDKFLSALQLMEITKRCLVDGDTLEDAGAIGTYSTPAQQRAWASGQLQAAISAMAVAGQFIDILHEQKRETSEALFRASYANDLRAREKAFFEAELDAEKAKKRRGQRKASNTTKLK